MKAAFIRQRPHFNVISYGNGVSYTLEHKPSYRSVYFQGDDADRFKAELDALEDVKDTDDALVELWALYRDLVDA